MVKYESLHAALKDYIVEADVQKVEDLTDAILDGHAIPSLGDLSFLKGCALLGYLSLNKCDIRKLEAFPAGLKLERLEICDNKIHDGLDALVSLENLEELHMGGNKIESLAQLQPLAKLSKLRILDLTECPVVEKQSDIASKIFELVPHLEAFNGKDASGESVDFEDGSDDLDDYSSEDDSDDNSNDSDDSNDDSEGSEDDEEDDDEVEGEKPSKSARRD